MKQIIAVFLLIAILIPTCVGCESTREKVINVVSREEGSGTRGAFADLFDLTETDSMGQLIDNILDEAEITDKTAVVMTTVAADPNAVGYISFGSLNDTVKAVKINGVAPSVETLNDGSYKMIRPLSIVTKEDTTPAVEDFIDFIDSKQGQAIVKENRYVALETDDTYKASGISGTITIGGSSSVTPLMEKLTEAYGELNPKVTIKLQTTDTTTGIADTANGTIDMGMISRDLTEKEEKGLDEETIAKDGLVVIVNATNDVDSLTKAQVKAIFSGETNNWNDL